MQTNINNTCQAECEIVWVRTLSVLLVESVKQKRCKFSKKITWQNSNYFLKICHITLVRVTFCTYDIYVYIHTYSWNSLSN